MPKLTPEMKDMIQNNQCFVGTIDPEGNPNLGPKGSTRVLDDEHLAFTEVTGGQTYANLQAKNVLSVAVVDRSKMDGYRFTGKAELLQDGELYDSAKEAMNKRGFPTPKALVRIKVDKIFSLKPGPAAGQLIAE